MGVRFRLWWKERKGLLLILGLIALLVVVIVLAFVEVRLYGTGFAGKTLWEWLQLLIISLVLAVGGGLFTFTISRSDRKAADRHNQTEREIAQDNQRGATLQEYINKISELLLHEKLRVSQPEDEVCKIARVLTLTALPQLDIHRKRIIIQFLHESGLIHDGKSIIDLSGADLIKAYLSSLDLDGANLSRTLLAGAELMGTNLAGANLSNTSLFGANLTSANLAGANLKDASISLNYFVGAEPIITKLYEADLTGANLSGARLCGANLSNTNLLGADLSGADLSGAKMIKEQLAKAKSLKGTIMPDGSIYP